MAGGDFTLSLRNNVEPDDMNIFLCFLEEYAF